jgi:hypothetical protein
MGIPIVASRLPVLEDLFSDSGITFFEPGSVKDFACCVLELYRRPDRRRELVRRVDETYMQTHSWAYERRTYFGLLSRLVGLSVRIDAQEAPGDRSSIRTTQTEKGDDKS